MPFWKISQFTFVERIALSEYGLGKWDVKSNSNSRLQKGARVGPELLLHWCCWFSRWLLLWSEVWHLHIYKGLILMGKVWKQLSYTGVFLYDDYEVNDGSTWAQGEDIAGCGQRRPLGEPPWALCSNVFWSEYQLDGKNLPALEPLPYQSSTELLVFTHLFLMKLNVLRSKAGAVGVRGVQTRAQPWPKLCVA